MGLHSVDPMWYTDFRSKSVYEKAGYPAIPAEVLEFLPNTVYDATDEPNGVHSIVQIQLNILGMVLPEELQSAKTTRKFLESEIRQWVDHPVLKGVGGAGRGGTEPPNPSSLNRTVTGHGDLHGANILSDDGEPVFIDFETAYVGPAGWDAATLYQCLRRYTPGHDYAQAAALARGYLRGTRAHGEPEPTTAEIDQFILDMVCWWYFANMRQALCWFLVIRLGGLPKPPNGERWDFAMKTLTPEYAQRFAERVQAARANPGGAEFADLVNKGNLDFL